MVWTQAARLPRPAAIMLASTLNTFLSSSKRIWERTPSTTTSCSSLVSSAKTQSAKVDVRSRHCNRPFLVDVPYARHPHLCISRPSLRKGGTVRSRRCWHRRQAALLVLASISCTVANAIGSPLLFKSDSEMSPFAYAIAGSNAIAARIFICLFHLVDFGT